mmetsp:Transcript_34701/g.75948  ORF Transcript_34701/g.75948 Transcript_34701/m.75948 type:complete len:89 (+) Transcript_34701:252-518(+)|eukprot:CAMPEP_0178540400 /NCGR_PEP_ID=MMETSP0697-20121206/1006_1 /TAXON_ID=265572 /ORGANISM="Extubocellulus spinifer, Strain CCMP396" /LENGTH=88 /DNA_ID=CAMNT_0020172733 /DNA_START=249 /DNA_END=515 /DNA_ORIENTATION=-
MDRIVTNLQHSKRDFLITFALVFVVAVTLEGNTRKVLMTYLLGSFLFRTVKPGVRDRLVEAAEEHNKAKANEEIKKKEKEAKAKAKSS